MLFAKIGRMASPQRAVSVQGDLRPNPIQATAVRVQPRTVCA